MLTIFTTPKAFKGHFVVIQENAIASWCQLRPKCQIILVGDDFGTAKIARKYHLTNIKNVARNMFGTPLLPDIFKKAYENAQFEKLAYINCDVILMDDFIESTKHIKLRTFFMTGSRWELNLKTKMGFQNDWQKNLKAKVLREGHQKRVGATDYFIFSPKIDFQIPNLAVGRTFWDTWLIFKAKQLKIPIVDATEMVWAIHQTHDYSHAGGWAKVWLGAESRENKKLIGDQRKYFNVLDADYILTRKGLNKPGMTLARIIRKIETLPVLTPKTALLVYPLNFLIRTIKFVRDKVGSLLFNNQV